MTGKNTPDESAKGAMRTFSSSVSKLLAKLGRGGQASLWSLGLKVSGAALLLMLHIMLVRISSSSDYGAYIFAFTFASLAAILVQSGLGQVSLRFASIYVAESNGSALRTLLQFVAKRLLIAIGFVCAACVPLVYLLGTIRPGLDWRTLMWSVTLVPLVAVLAVNEQTMRATGSVQSSLFPTQIAFPILFAVSVLVLMTLDIVAIDSTTMVVVHASVALAVLVGQSAVVRQRVRAIAIGTVENALKREEWKAMNARSFRVLLFNAVLAKSDLLMLGVLAGASASGAYAVCLKIGGLISFVQISINHALSPRIAVAWKQNDVVRLQALVSRSTALMFAVECILAMVLMILAGPFLDLFGDAYRAELWALWIIVASYVYVAYAGIVNSLLNLSGQQRQMQFVYAGACALNILLNILIIPIYGVIGAAATTFVTTVALRYALVRCVRAQVGVDPVFRVSALRALSAR